MKKIIVPLLLIGVSAGLSYLVAGWTIRAEVEKESSYRADVLETQIEFMRNNSALRPILDMQQRPDLQKYLNEVNVLVNWYFKNPAKKLWEKHADLKDPEAIIKKYRADAAVEGKKQRKAQGNLPIREECFQISKGIYDELKAGTYKAVASAYKGSVRLDIHKVVLDSNKLKWEIVVWGGIGDIVYDGWTMRLFKPKDPKVIAEYDKELARLKRRGREVPPDLIDPRTQSDAESRSASKAPVLPPFYGSDYIPDFPAGAQLNYFVTPSCIPDAEKMEIKFMMKARAMSGQDQTMEYAFELPVDASWKGNWDGVRSVEAAGTY